MICNSFNLLALAPIADMESTKRTAHGTSFGLSEAGYDIRIAQSVRFTPVDGKMTVSIATSNRAQEYQDGIEGNFVLASAIELFQMPDSLMGVVHDKSTWARKKLSVFNTVIEPGWSGYLTLELVYHGDDELVIPAGSGIAQVIFHELSCRAKYHGKYQNQGNEPTPARYVTGGKCSVCHAEQFMTPSGVSCKNDHGGAEPL